MHITASRQTSTPPTLFPNRREIPKTTHIHLLGVIIDQHFDFHRHVQNVVSGERWLLGFVIRSTRRTSPDVHRLLFTALALAILEFCCSVWDSATRQRVASLESVQRRDYYRIMRRQHSPRTPSYRALHFLRSVERDPLQHRRQVATTRLLATFLLPDSSVPFASSLRRTRTGGLQPLVTHTLRH
uniref:Putative endonuclease/reverse transcript n=1 Tax=Ixodes ricinus TaxID=34613 RepID=A0A6B0V0T1_IXORI